MLYWENEIVIRQSDVREVGEDGKSEGRLTLTNARLIFEKAENFWKTRYNTEYWMYLGSIAKVEVRGLVFKTLLVEWNAKGRDRNYLASREFSVGKANEWESHILWAINQAR